jgi:hypothetical protein
MSRKRVIYQSEAVFVGPSGGAGSVGAAYGQSKQLNRVQSANYSFNIARQNVNQFGQIGALDQVILEAPTVSLDFSYYANSGENEANLGLALGTDGSASIPALKNILSGGASAQDVKNYYIVVAPEGTDANLNQADVTGNGKVIGIGNAGLTSYSINAAVGGFPTVSVSAEGLNMRFYDSTTGHTPAINPADGSDASGIFAISGLTTGAGFSALRPGDITVTFSGAKGVVEEDLKIQDFTISFDLARDPIQKLGNRFAFSREITFPVTVSATINAVLGELEAENLSTVIASDCADADLTISMLSPKTCEGGAQARALLYTLKGAKLTSQSFTSSIGANKTISLQYSAFLGGPSETTKGLFIDAPTP